jgi:hypothetical protein
VCCAGNGSAHESPAGSQHVTERLSLLVVLLLLQVMRLHALSVRKVPANPLTPAATPPPAADAAAADPAAAAAAPAWASAAPGLRASVLSLLGGPLAGDELAAEYLLLTCLSSVSVWAAADWVVGMECMCSAQFAGLQRP